MDPSISTDHAPVERSIREVLGDLRASAEAGGRAFRVSVVGEAAEVLYARGATVATRAAAGNGGEGETPDAAHEGGVRKPTRASAIRAPMAAPL
jgi:hypothetical protein